MSHITVAASEEAFRELFAELRDNFTFSNSNSEDFDTFSASYDIALHLENGTVDLLDANTVQINKLKIKFDTLLACIDFNLSEYICGLGGQCIIPTPIGCVLRVPDICWLIGDPDINCCLDLGGIITSEILATVKPVVKYRVDPGRTPSMSDLDAEDAGIPNKWQIFIDPVTVDFDVFAIDEIIGDLLENAVRTAIEDLLSFLPGFLKDLIWAILGPIIDLIRAILAIPDDIGEWLSHLLGVSLGLFNIIITAVADYFAKQYPIVELEDPFPILESSGGLIPVKIPVRDLDVRVNTNEMIIEANVGV